MKKVFKLFVACVIASCAISCSVTTPVTATSNPVGNKVGVAKSTVFLNFIGGNDDLGINSAAKNGGITRISHVDRFEKNYGLWRVFGVRVYGE